MEDPTAPPLEYRMAMVSIVIPAFNEQENIAQTIRSIPADRLRERGTDVEIVVVDNASTDDTGRVAQLCGATVVVQPVRGYGNAYKAGFANSRGDIIATGDADLTYPFEILPEVLAILDAEGLDFLSTDRLGTPVPGAMSRSHRAANVALTALTRVLFDLPFHDSQSGMWVFRRNVWECSRVRSGGMGFSQELKVAAFRNGFRCGEVPIAYRTRGGQRKLRPVRDGVTNIAQMLSLWIRPRTASVSARDSAETRALPANAGHFLGTGSLPATETGAHLSLNEGAW